MQFFHPFKYTFKTDIHHLGLDCVNHYWVSWLSLITNDNHFNNEHTGEINELITDMLFVSRTYVEKHLFPLYSNWIIKELEWNGYINWINKELDKPCVYILLSNPDIETWEVSLYIGETNNAAVRLIQHLQKAYWQKAFIFSCKDFFNKAHCLQLEHLMIQEVLGFTKEDTLYSYPFVLENITQTNPQKLWKTDTDIVNLSLRNIKMILDSLQLPIFLNPETLIFQNIPYSNSKKPLTQKQQKAIDTLNKLTRKNWAKTRLSQKEFPQFSMLVTTKEWEEIWRAYLQVGYHNNSYFFILEESSVIRLSDKNHSSHIKKDDFLKLDELKYLENKKGLYLNYMDILFTSPTEAAEFVLSTSCNWWKVWMTDEWKPLSDFLQLK